MQISKLPQNQSRKLSFDGLRGAAAIIVVVHHLLLTLPWFADRVSMENLNRKGEFTISVYRLLEYTPLHLFYAGTEAVVVFFVLSGYVLVHAVDLIKTRDYVLNRFIRLYIPIFVAVLFSGIFLGAQDRTPLAGATWWLNSHAIPFSGNSFIRNIWVLDGTDWMNSSLWSMRYEVIFSLVVLIFASVNLRTSILKFLVSMLAIGLVLVIGIRFEMELLTWLPVFFAGSALHLLPERYFAKSFIKFSLGCFVILLPWYVAGFGYTMNNGVSRVFMTIGAVFIVDSCREESSSVSRMFTTKFFRSAGKYSYSLYLIHVPILTSVWFAMGFTESKSGWLLRTFVSISCIAVGTFLVYKLAEEPSLKWIKRRQQA
jgi:peptidoglycan/LPS O-acetylase OafA/YrhL